MLTNDWIKGYVHAMNSLRDSYRRELVILRDDYYHGMIRCNQYKHSRYIILQHINTIKDYKNDLKQLIKKLNNPDS